jgi:hypothetical protein
MGRFLVASRVRSIANVLSALPFVAYAVACSSNGPSTPPKADSGHDSPGPMRTDAGSHDARTSDASPHTDAPHGMGDDAGALVDSAAAGDASMSCPGSVALTYSAPTDRAPHMASPPALPAVGSTYPDPTYGTTVLRVTGPTTESGDESFQVANEFWGNDWNTTATRFYLQDSSGRLLLYDFDPKTLTATSSVKMPLSSGGFSRTDPDVLYGLSGLAIAQYDFSTSATTTLVALDTIVPGVTGNALGVQAATSGLLVTSFGGAAQGEMPYLATWDPTSSSSHVLDVMSSTLDGKALGVTIGGGVNTFKMDVGGLYVAFTVSVGTGAWLWNLAAGTVTSIAAVDAVGSAAWVSKAPSGTYAYTLGSLANPSQTSSLITPPAATDSLASSSLEWKNATTAALAPIIVETMRPGSDTSPWHAWDDEILAVRTDGVLIAGDGGMQTEVWRFAHTFNTYPADASTYSDDFYYLYLPRVSQNGWFVLFDSNWNGSLGTDNKGQPRKDAFIAALPNPCGP